MGSERIEALEMALAHAEAEIEGLSETCRAQWREIDALKAEIGRLTRSLQAMIDEAEGRDAPPAHQKPPHY